MFVCALTNNYNKTDSPTVFLNPNNPCLGLSQYSIQH